MKVIDVPDMNDPDAVPEPANLRFLRRLVTVLTVVMIAGILAVAATLVIRLTPRAVPLPETLALPAGATAHAVTRTPDGWIVTTEDGRAFLYGTDGRARGELVLR